MTSISLQVVPTTETTRRSLRSTMISKPSPSTALTPESEPNAPLLPGASVGDIVTVRLTLTPENGFVPENLFDSSGTISFVLGWGNYLPAIHELVTGMKVGDHVENLSIDAGFGKRNSDMVIEVPKSNLKKIKTMDKIVEGATLNLQGGIHVLVVKVTKDTIVVDANHPLAGSSYSCSLTVLNIDRMPTNKLEYTDIQDKESQEESPFEIATFAMGCFWGVELAFMRTPGVVGTRAGYTQGVVADPSYQEVCQGETKHREAVLVVYDSRVVSYERLLAVYSERLIATASQYKIDLFKEEDEESLQYKHGIYFHNNEQRRLAEEFLASNVHRYEEVEVLKSAVFYEAEEEHQQYLYKGGQASRKNARETIRCYG
mmetsp:Transcript_23902/g.38971  ORF Transcript_23902/g.38971 Transcript_23902/m.38971 type:complete len:373 (+) Transcript_23902:172-1290(+)